MAIGRVWIQILYSIIPEKDKVKLEKEIFKSPISKIWDEKPILDNAWHLYYDNREVYERVLDIKRRLDPDHIFTSNLFCVGATECQRLTSKLPVNI